MRGVVSRGPLRDRQRPESLLILVPLLGATIFYGHRYCSKTEAGGLPIRRRMPSCPTQPVTFSRQPRLSKQEPMHDAAETVSARLAAPLDEASLIRAAQRGDQDAF